MGLARHETHTLQLTLSSTTGLSSGIFSRPLGNPVLSHVTSPHSPQQGPATAGQSEPRRPTWLFWESQCFHPHRSFPCHSRPQPRIMWQQDSEGDSPQSKHGTTCQAFQRNRAQHRGLYPALWGDQKGRKSNKEGTWYMYLRRYSRN